MCFSEPYWDRAVLFLKIGHLYSSSLSFILSWRIFFVASRIWTRVVRVEGENDDHKTTTTAPVPQNLIVIILVSKLLKQSGLLTNAGPMLTPYRPSSPGTSTAVTTSRSSPGVTHKSLRSSTPCPRSRKFVTGTPSLPGAPTTPWRRTSRLKLVRWSSDVASVLEFRPLSL